MDIAIKLVRLAAKNGSDLIKLQTYNADTITLNSSKPEFIIKDKKVYGNLENFMNCIRRVKHLESGIINFFKRQKI